jgi:hypothetical protein
LLAVAGLRLAKGFGPDDVEQVRDDVALKQRGIRIGSEADMNFSRSDPEQVGMADIVTFTVCQDYAERTEGASASEIEQALRRHVSFSWRLAGMNAITPSRRPQWFAPRL